MSRSCQNVLGRKVRLSACIFHLFAVENRLGDMPHALLLVHRQFLYLPERLGLGKPPRPLEGFLGLVDDVLDLYGIFQVFQLLFEVGNLFGMSKDHLNRRQQILPPEWFGQDRGNADFSGSIQRIRITRRQ